MKKALCKKTALRESQMAMARRRAELAALKNRRELAPFFIKTTN